MIQREDLERIDLSSVDSGAAIPAVSPGEVLRAEFMEPLSVSARTLAKNMDVPPNRITGILHGERAITADTAIRLGHQLGTSAEFWMNLQTAYDLENARGKVSAFA